MASRRAFWESGRASHHRARAPIEFRARRTVCVFQHGLYAVGGDRRTRVTCRTRPVCRRTHFFPAQHERHALSFGCETSREAAGGRLRTATPWEVGTWPPKPPPHFGREPLPTRRPPPPPR